jgi:hypothetical protein
MDFGFSVGFFLNSSVEEELDLFIQQPMFAALLDLPMVGPHQNEICLFLRKIAGFVSQFYLSPSWNRLRSLHRFPHPLKRENHPNHAVPRTVSTARNQMTRAHVAVCGYVSEIACASAIALNGNPPCGQSDPCGRRDNHAGPRCLESLEFVMGSEKCVQDSVLPVLY